MTPNPITVTEGTGITATCSAQGSPTITYRWYKGNSNTEISTGAALNIASSSRTDTGSYTCRATNNYGSGEASVNVDVRCKYTVLISF